MFPPLSWLFRKLTRRYDSSAIFLHKELPELEPSRWERWIRWLFGAPFRGENKSEFIVVRWLQCVLLAIVYAFFLWLLYESYWAWGIFD